jgi:hypothetical protein
MKAGDDYYGLTAGHVLKNNGPDWMLVFDASQDILA